MMVEGFELHHAGRYSAEWKEKYLRKTKKIAYARNYRERKKQEEKEASEG